MHEIIPAVLEKTEEALKAKIASLPPEITFFQMDVLEEDVWSTEITQDFEVHLMVENPEAIIGKWIERGAKRISIHKISGSLAEYRKKAEIGFAIKLDQPLEEVLPFLHFVDFVHVMSIDEIGAQGHPLDVQVFDRIKTLQEQFPELPISVDGGVNVHNYEKLLELGADRLIVGSGFNELWNSLKKD
jgi:pentose-5-phosphate-3-epimerase